MDITRKAVEALANYLEKKNFTLLKANELGAFYSVNPEYTKLITKKSVREHGSMFGLTWKTNTPQVDEILRKGGGRGAGGIGQALVPPATAQSRESRAYLLILQRFILKEDPKGSPPKIMADSLDSLYAVHPNLKGHCTKSNIMIHGTALGLGWQTINAKNYITASMMTVPTSATSLPFTTTFVDSVAVAIPIVEKLRAARVLALDIEGDLSKDGRLSLIQIAADLSQSQKTTVYIFDMLTCPDIMTRLGDLLQTDGAVKVIHDCRQDSQALFYQYNVKLQNVFDTQSAFRLLDDGPDAHIRKGLNVVLDRYAGLKNDLKQHVQHMQGLWESRPLPAYLQSYAEQDVAYLLKAYRQMSFELINKGLMAAALEASKLQHVTMTTMQDSSTTVVKSDVPAMGLLQEATKGTTKYVSFTPDGLHQLSDEPFPTKTTGTTSRDGSDLTDLGKLISIFPPHIKEAFYAFPLYAYTTEVVLDEGKRPLVRYEASSSVDSNDATATLCIGTLNCSNVTRDDLDKVCRNDELGKFSTDNRAGLSGTLHRISRKLNRNNEVFGLTIRVGRMVEGSTLMIADIVASNRSVLLLGIPGVGKTTLLREYARVLANNAKRVEIVDTSNEIAGDGNIPHNSVGNARRMMVNKREEQYQVMIEAVQNHTPQCIIVDEIGTKREAVAAGDIAQRGVKIIATAHGTKLQDLLQNSQLCSLLGGVHSVILGDEEARRRGLRSKSVRERIDVPVFDTIVELRNHNRWVVYHNVAEAVDMILGGQKAPMFEIRSQDVVTGNIQVTKTDVFE